VTERARVSSISLFFVVDGHRADDSLDNTAFASDVVWDAKMADWKPHTNSNLIANRKDWRLPFSGYNGRI
jgi:hypothetical protein